MLEDLSVSRAQQGFSPSETASFIFSLKQPLFDRLQKALGQAEAVTRLWPANLMLDRLGLYTTEVFQRGREQVIIRQQQETDGASRRRSIDAVGRERTRRCRSSARSTARATR
jgi:rsbT co-antagonist protein RsbR